MRREEENSFLYGVDKFTILLYLLLVFLGWVNVYSAAYNEEHPYIYDMSQKYGKQLLWIGTSAVLALIILMVEANFITAFAYVIYGIVLVACIAVPYLGREVSGSRSWFRFGDFGVQPAEFMKFAANLALAKFLSNANLKVGEIRNNLNSIIQNFRNTIIAGLIIGFPLIIIKVLQDETGLALVFIAFVFTLYREGLSVNFLIIGLLAILLLILGLVFNPIMIFIFIGSVALLSFLFVRRNRKNVILILAISIAACGLVYGAGYFYNKLEKHQKTRINVMLHIGEINEKKEGYNENQSKIAIATGGLTGKGFLEGTQTKGHYVPEQHTDFIFCTVGEEWGFVGGTTVLILELILMLRLIMMAERQRSPFSRIYGYGVASVLFFHVFVNVGMTIGLMPVIGIPLPFFSYGGSSLWSFTILLFIFIKLDANRIAVLR